MRKLAIVYIISIIVSVLGYKNSIHAEWIEGGNPLPQDFSHMVVFDSVGTFTWTVPEGVYKIKVELWGGGGGGVNVSGTYRDQSCYGGAGGYGLVYIDVTPGSVCAITVGNGGSSGEDGGNSTIVCGSQAYTATGGEGAYSSGSSCYPGDGGTANTPFSLEGQGGTIFTVEDPGTTDPDRWGDQLGGSAPRGGHGYTVSDGAAQPGGGGGTGAPGMVIIWY